MYAVILISKIIYVNCRLLLSMISDFSYQPFSKNGVLCLATVLPGTICQRLSIYEVPYSLFFLFFRYIELYLYIGYVLSFYKSFVPFSVDKEPLKSIDGETLIVLGRILTNYPTIYDHTV